LNTGRRTWYQNELVDASVDGSLLLQGHPGNFAVNGQIVTEQGAIVYSGNEFKIRNATLEIINKPTGIESDDKNQTLIYLKATAEKEVYYTDGLGNNTQDTIVMVVDRSLLGEIQPRFYAKNNPNISSQKALQLALGLPMNEAIETNSLLPDQRGDQAKNHEDTNKLLRVSLVQLLDSSLASPLARAIARNTGLVEYIRVSYQEPGTTSDTPLALENPAGSTNITQNQFLRYAKGTKVKFGREITNRLFADYSFRVDEYQNQLDLKHEVSLAYRLHGNFYLKGVSELDSQRTLGRPPDRRAIFENQWRFGLPKKKKPAQNKESRATRQTLKNQLTKTKQTKDSY
jgi:hypothetical protein